MKSLRGTTGRRGIRDRRGITQSDTVADSIANRVPYINWMPRGFRPHFVAMCGEFVGTWLFLFFALSGTQVANTTAVGQTTQTSTTGTVLYISLCFGFSLVVNAWVFFRISGGLFNPAVTLGLCLVGGLSWFRGSLLFLAQMFGAMTSAAVVSALFPGDLAVETTLNGGTSTAQGLFIEMFLTAQLVFTIFMLAAEKHKATFIAPVGIGLSLFIAELTGVYFTGGSLNPARSFAPGVVLRRFPGYHWIYWFGPAFGAVLAAGFYAFIKKLEYETANPGQDHDETDAMPEDVERDAADAAPGRDLSSGKMTAPNHQHPQSPRQNGNMHNHEQSSPRMHGGDMTGIRASTDITRRPVPKPTAVHSANTNQPTDAAALHAPAQDSHHHGAHRQALSLANQSEQINHESQWSTEDGPNTARSGIQV